MKNSEIVLEMVTNRLQQLLDLNAALKNQWEAEIMEIVHLGLGVIRPAQRSSEDIKRDMEGRYETYLSVDELEMLNDIIRGNSNIHDYDANLVEALIPRLDFVISRAWVDRDNEMDDNYRDDEPDDDDPVVYEALRVPLA